MLKKIFAIALIFSLVFTSGCWDNVELDERAFTSTLTVDLNEEVEGDKGASKGNSPFDEDVPDKLKVTFALINPAKVQSGEGAFVPRTVECATLADAVDELGEETSRTPFFAHIRLLVLTEKLLKDPITFKEVLDKLERSPNLNQLMNIVVIKGTYKDFYEVEPKLEALLSSYVAGISRSSDKLSDTVSVTLSDFCSAMRSGDGSAVLPFLEIKKEEDRSEFKIGSIVLIKNYVFDRHVDSRYVRTYKVMNGHFNRGTKIINCNGVTIPLTTASLEKDIEVREVGDKLKFDVKISIEGDIEQYKFNEESFDPKFIDTVQKKLEESFQAEFEQATRYYQKDVGYDYLGFSDYTSKYKNKIFKKYEDNWEEAFRNAEINYKFKVNVRRIGTSKK